MSETPTPDEVYSRKKVKKAELLASDVTWLYRVLLEKLQSGDTYMHGYSGYWIQEGITRQVFDKFANNGWKVELREYDYEGKENYGFSFSPIPGYQFPKKEEKKPWRWWTLW